MPVWIPGWILIVLGVHAAMSLLAGAMLYRDKRAAEQGAWRVRETTLHTIELLGGWPGSWVVRSRLRHKTRKLGYRAVFWLIVGLHATGWAVVAWVAIRMGG